MKFDTLIIGGGLAGLSCGIRLAGAGRRCAIVSTGESALHFSSGSFDLLGGLPDGTPVDEPLRAIDALAAAAPEHPYAKIAGSVERLAADAAALLAEAGVRVTGDASRNHYRLTPTGAMKRTWLTLDGYVRSTSAEELPWRKAALFSIAGFLDFYPRFLTDALQQRGTQCELHSVSLPALEALRMNPTEMRSTGIARLFDRTEHLDALAALIGHAAADCEAILLPAAVGLERNDAVEYLSRKTGRTVAVVATLPPSVPGIRTHRQLRRSFERAGGLFLPGDTALHYDEHEGRITALHTANHGAEALEADNFVLATGSYFSRGLTAERTGIREPLFGVDTASAANRSEWYDRDLFRPQPFERFGVRTDSGLHALRGGQPVANLYAVGAILAGFDPIKEGCGAGVSMLTALYAAERILSR